MDGLSRYGGSDRVIILGAAVVIILAGIRMLSDFIGPLLVSIVVAVLFSVFSRYLQEKGVPPAAAHVVAFLLFILCLVAFLLLIALSAAPIIARIPMYEQHLTESLTSAQAVIDSSGVATGDAFPVSAIAGPLSGLVKGIVAAIVNQVTYLFVIIFTTFFLLLESAEFGKKMQYLIGPVNQQLLGNARKFSRSLVDYIIIRTKVNLAVGVLFGIALAFLGVDGFVLWAFLMFVLGYVPYIGFYLAILPPVAIAWIEISPFIAVLIVIIAIIVNQFVECIVFPELTGKELSLSPTVVFLSLLFWGALLGGSGFILGVPLTILVMMIADSSDETRWIAVLIGSEIPDQAPEDSSM